VPSTNERHQLTSTLLNLKFEDAASISYLLGNLSKSLNDGFEAFATSRMNEVPPPGFETDPTYLPQLLSGGSFAGLLKGAFTQEMADNFTAAIAGPGINLLWQYSGVVVAKVHKDNFPVDPCSGDTLLAASDKYCDVDGNMFSIQCLPDQAFGTTIKDGGLTDPTEWEAPGFSELSAYNLTVYDITQSAWSNQQKYGPGSTGPDPQDFINNLINEQPQNLPQDQYIFFNFWVCDFDKIDLTGNTHSVGQDQCGDYTAENAQCWFYFILAAVCPRKCYPDHTRLSWSEH